MGGAGGGIVYVSNGKIVGVGAENLRCSGTYIEQGGRIKGTVNLYAPTGGTLVTGAQVPADFRWSLTLDRPANFSDGKPQALMVEGRPIHIVREKIGDI
ncbi:hypothetical protein GGD66_002286 [Bradyrhizobium sp. CIR48]|uniref:hypothetical protein n=1 Tax=Bradyrhizobium sp. CIR48 TaxID=2663840 RepID=UPI0016069774|nr:hypothetical protein [Bradyrhizobium sp. CIR48]MBB4423742.1 hypothetical protein [Bradyrhizobium sp. CIR48]